MKRMSLALRGRERTVTVRSGRGNRLPAPGLRLRVQWRPGTRRSATLSSSWDGGTESRSDPWLSERYGRIAWCVRTSRLTIIWRYPVCGRSCRRTEWLKPASNLTGIDRYGENAVPTAPPWLGRTVTNDAERLSIDPRFRVIDSQKIWEPHDGSVKSTMPADHNFTAWERPSFSSIPLVLTGHFGPHSRRLLRRPGRPCQPNATPLESRSPGNCRQDLEA